MERGQVGVKPSDINQQRAARQAARAKALRRAAVRPRPPVAPAAPAPDDIPEIYKGQTAVLFATGPSLSVEQVETVRPYHEAGIVKAFGLNDAFKIIDYLDVYYACDPKWWELNPAAFDYPCPQKWTQDIRFARKFAEKGIKGCSGSSGHGLSFRKNHIHYGSNSGYQLINLAYHFGIRHFILLGYNMDVPKGMKQHFFGPHPKGLNQTNSYRGFIQQYGSIQPEVKSNIVNCTQPTALPHFRMISLEEALNEAAERRGRTPYKKAPEDSAVPEESRPADICGDDGSVGSDGSVVGPGTIRHPAPFSYGGGEYDPGFLD